MAFKLFDLVRESSISIGTGDLLLAGAVTTHKTFGSVLSNGDTTLVRIRLGTEFETCIATYNSGANSLTRGAIFESSNGGSAVNFSAGTKDIVIDLPSRRYSELEARAQKPGLANGIFTESRAANAATFSLKTLAGADPSAADPVIALFGNGTERKITSALSVTIPSGADVGVVNGSPFRLWISLTDDAATIRIGVRNCSSTSTVSVRGFPGGGIHTTTTMGTGSDSVGVTYTDTGATAKQFIPVAYADYDSGLTSKGAWDAAPTRIQMYGPGIKLPGEVVYQIYKTDSGATNTGANTTPVVTGLTDSIALSSPANLVRIAASGTMYSGAADQLVRSQIYRGAAAAALGSKAEIYNANAAVIAPAGVLAIDRPGTTSSTTYSVYVISGGSYVVTWNLNSVQAAMVIEEIMG